MNKGRERFERTERHLMEDKRPSVFFTRMRGDPVFFAEYPFTMLTDLIAVKQSPQHHPEGDVWKHTMMVVDRAAERRNESQDPRVLMWSALLHDLGKKPATRVRRGKITAYDHDKLGEKMAVSFLREITEDEPFIRKVSKMVRWHMQTLFVVKGLPFADIGTMLSDVPLEEIALLTLCDRLGRGYMNEEKAEEEREHVRIFVEKCREYQKKCESFKMMKGG